MIPILFEYDATTFTTHGLGDLVDCIECNAGINDEGEYELQFKYPVGAELYSELTINRIVVAKANPYDPLQAFRIYGYEREIDGVVTVNCQHISYDLSGIPTKDFKDKTTCASALAQMKTNAVVSCPFNFSTNIPDSQAPQIQEGKFKIEAPESIRACLLDGDDSIKGCWGGDLVFDNYNISLLTLGGADRGAIIEYGIDLVDLDQEESISEMVTAILPYYRYSVGNETTGEQTDYVTYGDIQYASGTFLRQNIQSVDLTDQFPNQARETSPTKQELNAKAQEYITANDIGKPEINLTIKHTAYDQDIRMHDAITVRFVKMGIDVKSKVTSYKYDVLGERCTEIEIGKTRDSSIFTLEDASRLRKGLIPPKRIQDSSITGSKLGGGSVGGRNVASGGIAGWHLRDGAVSEHKIDDEAVTEDKIGENAVTVLKVKDGAITRYKIKEGEVIEDRILNKAVTLAKLSNDLQVFYATTIAANSIVAGFVTASYTDIYYLRSKTMLVETLQVSGTLELAEVPVATEQHYHHFTERNGSIYISQATHDQGSFKIADTQAYKDGVSAAKTEGAQSARLSSLGVGASGSPYEYGGSVYADALVSYTVQAVQGDGSMYSNSDSLTKAVDVSAAYNAGVTYGYSSGYTDGSSDGYSSGYTAGAGSVSATGADCLRSSSTRALIRVYLSNGAQGNFWVDL